jgi:hypothetical protein
MHYMVIGQPKPDGTPYTNTDADWTWLSGDAAKAARWLGYLPFEQIVDQRNAPPEVKIWSEPEPRAYVTVGARVEIPEADDLMPTVLVDDFLGVQPYKIVMFGEKSSLAPVLRPLAQRYQGDLYLPTGEISDTLLYKMASIGAADGRPMIVFCFSDADPAGWQMPISIARKLQAFRVTHFPRLEVEVHRVALLPDQVRAYGLPSTPLKDTERRADRWREQMHVEQTEIDALAALQPDLLRELAESAIAPFFDATLRTRVTRARQAWETEAQAVLDHTLDAEQLAQIRTQAEERLAVMRDQLAEINDALRIDVTDIDLPDIVVPDAELDDHDGAIPLYDSHLTFKDQCEQLIDSKAYRLP